MHGSNGKLMYQNSLVFVSHTHGLWNTAEARRKPSKRYGQLIQSPRTGLSEMLTHHKTDVFKWIENRADDEEESEPEAGATTLTATAGTGTGTEVES